MSLARLAPPALVAVLLLVAASCGADPAGPDDPGPVPNGQLFFAGYDRGNWDVYSIGADGTGLRRLTSGPEDDLQPALSPDGRRLAFFSARQPAGIYVMDTEGGVATLAYALTGLDTSAEQVSWSPDGQRLAFQILNNVVIVRVDGTGRVVRFVAQAPDWAPDGRGLAVELDGRIFRVNDEGSGHELLVADGQEPAWSPDGRELAFARTITHGHARILRLRLGDATPVPVTAPDAGSTDRWPEWSADGTRLAFTRVGRIGTIWVSGADGQGARQVGPLPTGSASAATW